MRPCDGFIPTGGGSIRLPAAVSKAVQNLIAGDVCRRSQRERTRLGCLPVDDALLTLSQDCQGLVNAQPRSQCLL